MKAIKSDSDSDSDEQKKVARFFRKNRGVTPSLAAPGVIHPSDATDRTWAKVLWQVAQEWIAEQK